MKSRGREYMFVVDVIYCVSTRSSSRTHVCSLAPRSSTIMSLLQDVLRHQTMDSIERRFDTTHPDSDNSDDELVNVVRRLSSLYYVPN